MHHSFTISYIAPYSNLQRSNQHEPVRSGPQLPSTRTVAKDYLL